MANILYTTRVNGWLDGKRLSKSRDLLVTPNASLWGPVQQQHLVANTIDAFGGWEGEAKLVMRYTYRQQQSNLNLSVLTQI